jgi:hypothetical protein
MENKACQGCERRIAGALFCAADIIRLDTKTGRTRWERRDLECNHYRGAGSSSIGGFTASPAVAGKAPYLPGRTHLYRIGS